jgi:hypothetical protein
LRDDGKFCLLSRDYHHKVNEQPIIALAGANGKGHESLTYFNEMVVDVQVWVLKLDP